MNIYANIFIGSIGWHWYIPVSKESHSIHDQSIQGMLLVDETQIIL
jgi:hypothetical protein